ncbi:MAG: glutamate--tRNA ligase [Pseudomonadota bacterium]|nr:glutamate--tRNA ligase [Pseudomonadota bacterium]
MVKVRFAPSPTGFLHVGNVRTALVNWLFARRHGGHFLLRIDDTDPERSRQEYANAIMNDLEWLGLNWDGEAVWQSTRFDRYRRATEELKIQNRLYPCYETAEELDMQRKMLAGRGLPPIYNRAGLKLSDEQKKKYEAEGRRPHYRFLLNDEEVSWNDLIRGPAHFKATHMSDPVLLREDGVPVYTLASVVDDGEMHITHVVRGEDHVSNTAVQIQIYKALGFAVPEFAHMALLKTKEGELSKRLGGNDIRSLREASILPMAINSLLARIGTSKPVEPMDSLDELVRDFDFSAFGRAPAIFDPAELERLNTKLLHEMEYDEALLIMEDLAHFSDEAFWLSIRANIKTLAEARQWWDILHGDIQADLNHDDRAFARSTIASLPPEPWNETTYDTWIAAVKPATARKGKELFLPLRKALTGQEQGPELKKLLPLLGREKVMERLSA